MSSFFANLYSCPARSCSPTLARDSLCLSNYSLRRPYQLVAQNSFRLPRTTARDLVMTLAALDLHSQAFTLDFGSLFDPAIIKLSP